MSLTRPLSRRRLLLGTAALTGGVLTGCRAAGPTPTPTPASALADLQRSLPGRVLLPGASGYQALVSPWNLRWTGQRPQAAVIVRARSTEDVATAVRWARNTGTAFVARSGGHSYAGWSSTPGLLVDLSAMTEVAYDAGSGTATLAGGVRNINAYAALRAAGRTITHGRCYQVGYAGLVLGGGIGFNMRRLGLTCDQLAATTVVLANGDVVTASAKQKPDLFWAVRGAGGGNFGIHTAFEVRTAAAGTVTAFDQVWTERIDDVLPVLLDTLRTAPRELGVKVTVRATPQPDGKPTLTVGLLGQFAGPTDDLWQVLQPVTTIAKPDPELGFLKRLPYWDAQKLLSDEGKPEYGYERSRYVQGTIGGDDTDDILRRLRAWPGLQGVAQWKGFLTGGAVTDVAPEATAFVHRRDWLLATVDLVWSAEDSAATVQRSVEWLDEFHDAMGAYATTEAYQNFIDAGLTDWARAYYGTNLARLTQVKRSYDPDGVFRYPQSIPASG